MVLPLPRTGSRPCRTSSIPPCRRKTKKKKEPPDHVVILIGKGNLNRLPRFLFCFIAISHATYRSCSKGNIWCSATVKAERNENGTRKPQTRTCKNNLRTAEKPPF